MSVWTVVALVLVLAGAPFLAGVTVRVKARLAGRQGPPVLQLYYDLARLLRKDSVISVTTTILFRLGPVITLSGLLVALLLLPLDGRAAVLSFAGDPIAFAGLLALGRFALVLSAMDTGSSFEGMGASRDVTVASFAEPALFLCLVALVLATGELTLAGMLGAPLSAAWPAAALSLTLVGIALFVLLLAENARVPVDDPATHLELTMIHEAMVLDHSGRDFAVVQYGSALKLAVFGTLVIGALVPRATLPPLLSLVVLAVGLIVVAALVGVVESVTARLRLVRVPQLLVGTSVLALFGIVLLLA